VLKKTSQDFFNAPPNFAGLSALCGLGLGEKVLLRCSASQNCPRVETTCALNTDNDYSTLSVNLRVLCDSSWTTIRVAQQNDNDPNQLDTSMQINTHRRS